MMETKFERRASPRVKPQHSVPRVRNEERILTAAIDVFSRKGFDGTRIADIAALAGLPHPNIHYYFRSKADIYRRLIDQLVADWDQALEHISPDREPMDAIAGYVRAKFEHTRLHAAETRLFANEVMNGARFLSPATRRHINSATQRSVCVMEGWIAARKLAPMDARHFLIMIWATTQFYSFSEPIVRDTLSAKELSKRHYDQAAKTLIAILTSGCSSSEMVGGTAKPTKRRTL